MVKKKGKKKKGKKDKPKGGLTNRERQIFLLTVDELEHKIAWREHLCVIIDEDLKLYEEKLELQRTDKAEAVNILEEAIEEQRVLSEKIERTLPDAEKARVQAEEGRAEELASKLMQMNEEKISYDAQLEALRKKLMSLENYNPEMMREKINDIEKQLESEDNEDTVLKRLEQEKRRQEAFRRDMLDILAKEADAFQEEIAGKLDKKFERITEETRWWKNNVSGLKIATKRLEALNDVKVTNIKSSKKELKERKIASLQENQQLQEGDVIISGLLRRDRELKDRQRSIAEHQGRLFVLDDVSRRLNQTLRDRDHHLTTSFHEMKENENEIKRLEDKLSNEIAFGSHLTEFMERARELVTEEVKYSLILTYNGPTEKKKVIGELKDLFEKATKFIYDRKNRTML